MYDCACIYKNLLICNLLTKSLVLESKLQIIKITSLSFQILPKVCFLRSLTTIDAELLIFPKITVKLKS